MILAFWVLIQSNILLLIESYFSKKLIFIIDNLLWEVLNVDSVAKESMTQQCWQFFFLLTAVWLKNNSPKC